MQPANPLLSPKHIAEQQKTSHQFVPGIGYLRHPEAPLPGPGSADPMSNPCAPPAVTPDGSAHVLRAPKDGGDKVFAWVEAEAAWERAGGHRMAFTAAYLAHHGWSYVGPAGRHDEIAA